MKKCEQCQDEFEQVRASARFCSPKCRVAYSRRPEMQRAAEESVKAVAERARKLQQAADAVTSRLKPCCKHCPPHAHAAHLDPCRQGCA